MNQNLFVIFDSLWRIKFARIKMNRFGPSPFQKNLRKYLIPELRTNFKKNPDYKTQNENDLYEFD